MEGKGSFFILLFIVAFLSLSLAILAGYVFFVAGNDSHTTTEVVQSAEPKRPADEELAVMPLFEGKKYFNLKSANESSDNKSTPVAKSIAVIQVNLELQYFKKVKGIKNVEEKIAHYQSEIRELVGTYFQNMTLDQAADSSTKEKAKKELTHQMNTLLNSSEKEKKDIIYTVIFDEWFFQ